MEKKYIIIDIEKIYILSDCYSVFFEEHMNQTIVVVQLQKARKQNYWSI